MIMHEEIISTQVTLMIIEKAHTNKRVFNYKKTITFYQSDLM